MCLFSVACRNDDAKSNSKQTPKNKYVFRAMEPKQCSSGKLFRAGLYFRKGMRSRFLSVYAFIVPSLYCFELCGSKTAPSGSICGSDHVH